MNTQLPSPDTFVEFEHEEFDRIIQGLLPTYVNKPDGPLKAVVAVQGHTMGSDIKWNDMSGTLWFSVRDSKKELFKLFGCELVHHTGNCGAKAISHIYMAPQLHTQPSELRKKIVAIMESFAYHKTNCGFLVGSDTDAGQYSGQSITIIRRDGEGYQFSAPTWNPNYVGMLSHKITLFYKDLNGATHHNYWGRPRVLSGTKQQRI